MKKIEELYQRYRGVAATSCRRLTAAGSHRVYYRLQEPDGGSVIGVQGTSVEENNAFVALAQHLGSKGIAVPRILTVSDDRLCYLQSDLGSTALYDYMAPCRKTDEWDGATHKLLHETMRQLARIQMDGDNGIDYEKVCFGISEFDKRSIAYDLNYFKYCFLKATGIEYDENGLQDDFEAMTTALLSASPVGLMYRDFQSRNVMVHEGQPWFIDFQGARRGAVHYDVASFLWQARAAYPTALRNELIDTYFAALQQFIPSVERKQFDETLQLFVLFRTLQVLGAYGFRGYYERKELFRQSIPQAIANMKELLQTGVADGYPCLKEVVTAVCNLPQMQPAEPRTSLCVKVYSFSYKQGVPTDDSGNGGGFVFDCRAIHNPGRYPEYAHLTGRDEAVRLFLEENGEIITFLDHVHALVDASVERYLKRGFTHLQVSFGCTGGQHRSVYAAEATAHHLYEKYNIEVELIHREQAINQHFTPRPTR